MFTSYIEYFGFIFFVCVNLKRKKEHSLNKKNLANASEVKDQMVSNQKCLGFYMIMKMFYLNTQLNCLP